MAAADKPDPKHFALFVSSVKGRVVTRFGTSEYIGARRLPTTKDERQGGAESVAWDEERVVALTHDELARFGREYQRAIKGGDLKKREATDWVAWLAQQEEAAARADAASKAAAEEEKAEEAEKDGSK